MPLDAALAVAPNLVPFRGTSPASGGGTPPPPSGIVTVPSGVWGMGFQNVGDIAKTTVGHPAGLAVSGGDVAGIHISSDGGDDWLPNNIGLTTVASLRCAGVRWSATVPNKCWYYSTSPSGTSPGGILWYGFYDSSIGGIVKWNQLCTVPSAIEGGLDLHPRGSKRQTIALDEANDLAYLATIDGIYKVTLSTGATSRIAFAGSSVTSIALDPLDRTIMFATTDTGTQGVHRITAVNTSPTISTRAPTDYLLAQACVPVVEGGVTCLYVATGKAVNDAAPTNSVVRWNGTSFTTAGNWTDITGTTLNTGNTTSAATRWCGIDAAAVGANTRILVTASSDVAQAGTETNVAWTLYNRSGVATWTKPSTGNTFLTINDGAGPTWWGSSMSRSLMMDKNVYDCTAPVIDPNDTSKLWLFGRSGVWRSIDAGAHWYPVVRGMCVTTAWHVLTKPGDDNKIVMGDTDWGIHRSTDGMVTQPITPSIRPTTDVGWNQAITPSGNRFLLCMGDRDVNTNGGAYTCADPWAGTVTWTNETITGTNAPYTTLTAAPRCTGGALGTDGAGNPVLLATWQAAGMLRRKIGTGAAGTWSTPTTGGVSVAGTANQQRCHFAWPGDGINVWMIDPSTGLWQSRDRGVTWTRRQTFSGTNAYQFHLKASESETGVYYYTRNGQVWKITAGDTASPVLTQLASGVIGAAAAIAVHPGNGKVVVAENGDAPTGGALWRSTDGGTSWTDVTVPSWETTCTTVKQMHFTGAGDLLIAMNAGYSRSTGL